MKITLYTISDCQFSQEEKNYLVSKNLPYEEKNLETNREFLTEMLALSNNFAGTPVTKIEKDDGQIIVLKGFTKEEFDKAFGFEAVTQAPAVQAPVTQEVVAPVSAVIPQATMAVEQPIQSIAQPAVTPTPVVAPVTEPVSAYDAPVMTPTPEPVAQPQVAAPIADVQVAPVIPTSDFQPVTMQPPAVETTPQYTAPFTIQEQPMNADPVSVMPQQPAMTQETPTYSPEPQAVTQPQAPAQTVQNQALDDILSSLQAKVTDNNTAPTEQPGFPQQNNTSGVN